MWIGRVDTDWSGTLSGEVLDMKGNRSNLSALASSVASGGQRGTAPNDDRHLSELVRCLRYLAADSPERQARIEHIARSYASGTYRVDAQATASKIIDDALKH
jgi:anti-sigma28 factor (negative regulator of flagellin synthesis)